MRRIFQILYTQAHCSKRNIKTAVKTEETTLQLCDNVLHWERVDYMSARAETRDIACHIAIIYDIYRLPFCTRYTWPFYFDLPSKWPTLHFCHTQASLTNLVIVPSRFNVTQCHVISLFLPLNYSQVLLFHIANTLLMVVCPVVDSKCSLTLTPTTRKLSTK